MRTIEEIQAEIDEIQATAHFLDDERLKQLYKEKAEYYIRDIPL